jgi:hypothetical protein
MSSFIKLPVNPMPIATGRAIAQGSRLYTVTTESGQNGVGLNRDTEHRAIHKEAINSATLKLLKSF